MGLPRVRDKAVTTTDGRDLAAPGGPAHPAGRQMEELSLDVQAKVLAGEVTSEKLASPADSLPPIEASPSGALLDLRDPAARQAEELRGVRTDPWIGQPGERSPHASIDGSAGPSGAAPRADVPLLGVRAEHGNPTQPGASAPAPGLTCGLCGKPSPGTHCEPCLRYELTRPAALLGYTRSEVDELADAAQDAARYWIAAMLSLRAQARRRAE